MQSPLGYVVNILAKNQSKTKDKVHWKVTLLQFVANLLGGPGSPARCVTPLPPKGMEGLWKERDMFGGGLWAFRQERLLPMVQLCHGEGEQCFVESPCLPTTTLRKANMQPEKGLSMYGLLSKIKGSCSGSMLAFGSATLRVQSTKNMDCIGFLYICVEASREVLGSFLLSGYWDWRRGPAGNHCPHPPHACRRRVTVGQSPEEL